MQQKAEARTDRTTESTWLLEKQKQFASVKTLAFPNMNIIVTNVGNYLFGQRNMCANTLLLLAEQKIAE